MIEKITDLYLNYDPSIIMIHYNNLISVLYFDEMGLTEISPNNPLKVIHSLLKNNENEDSKKIAFVIF